MAQQVWAVRRREYLSNVGTQQFMGLPEEEVARHLGAAEVFSVGREEAEGSSDWLPLRAYTATHYNYSWFVVGERPRRMAFGGELDSRGLEPPVLLDDSLLARAWEGFAREVEVERLDSIRLAALINDGCLGLIYVARLTQRIACPRGQQTVPATTFPHTFCTHGELLSDRERFDPVSRVMIENLACL